MKKNLYIAASLLAGLFLAQNAYSVDFNNTTAAPLLSIAITAANVPGAPATLTFNPSTNVLMAGHSVDTSFMINAYHTQALNKAAGQAYAMAADSNKMYFKSIEGTAVTQASIQVAGTNSASFTAASGYTKM